MKAGRFVLTLLFFAAAFTNTSAQQISPSVQQGHFSDVYKIALAPSGKTLATFGADRQIVFWDLKTGMQLNRMSYTDSLLQIFFVNDSILFLASAKDLTGKYFDVSHGTYKSSYKQTIEPYYENSSGRKYVINGPLLQVWENEKILKSHTTQYFDKGFTAFAVNKNNPYLFASSLDGWIYVYDNKTLKLVRTLRLHRASVHDIVLNKEGTLLYSTGNDRSVIEWDANTLELKRRLHAHSFRITSLAFDYDGNKLIFGNELGELKSIGLSSLAQQLSLKTISNHPIQNIIRDNTTGDSLLRISTLENSMYLIDPEFKKEKKSGRYHRIGFKQAKRVVLEDMLHTYNEPSIKQFPVDVKGNLMVYHGDEKGGRWRRKIIVNNLKSGHRKILRSSQGKISHITVINDTLFAVARNPSFYYIGNTEPEIELWKIKGRKFYKAKIPNQYFVKGLATHDGKHLVILSDYGKVQIFNPVTGNVAAVFSVPGETTGLWIMNNLCMIATAAHELFVYQIEEGNNFTFLHKFTGHEGNILDVDIRSESKTLATASEDATIKFWSLEKKELLATLIPVDQNDFIFLLPNGDYQITKKAYRMFGFNQGLNFYYPDQFDLRYNRPHEILAAIKSGTDEEIAALKKAYEKRLKRMGFSENNLSQPVALPEVKIFSAAADDNNKVKLMVEAMDKFYSLDRINVMVNNVSVFGSAGYPLKEKNIKSWKGEIPVSILEGNNKIEVSVLNEKGIESYRSSVVIKGNKAPAPVLHLIAIGVSHYMDKTFDLEYPSKDAHDMAKSFASDARKIYSEVRTCLITDSLATKEKIEATSKAFLAGANANDVVIVFIAGHGVLDKEMNYYLATFDMDFKNPEGRGMPYEKLESLLDGIAPLKKTLFIDACHSGELDKDEVEQLVVQNSTQKGNVKFRTAGAGIQKKNLGLQSTSELMSELFTDLRRGTGATVVSSAGGAEYAMESAEWKNGLFTYCLLHGLKSRRADINHDGSIMLSELQKYLQEEVMKLSKGQQKPTSRIENLSLDFRIW